VGYLKNEMVELHLGDCLDFMRGMDTASVDAVVIDPPFGIGFEYGDGKEVASNPLDYWKWLEPRYSEALRTLRAGGFVAVWQAQLNFPHFWEWFGSQIHIYCAAKNFVQLRKTPINYGYDPVVMFYKEGADPLRPNKPRRSIDYFVANTAGIISDTTRIEKGHPCPRPLDAVEQVIDNFVAEGGTVLDCFMGSGTTGVACVKLGRNFIGCEINPDYFQIAERRIAEAQLQAPLPLTPPFEGVRT
jgi:site-specific DNA-methyltransferase (adenine-specific)